MIPGLTALRNHAANSSSDGGERQQINTTLLVARIFQAQTSWFDKVGVSDEMNEQDVHGRRRIVAAGKIPTTRAS